MEEKTYQVKTSGNLREYPAGTSYGEIARDFQKDYKNDIVLVFANGKLQELHKTLQCDTEIKFVTTGDEIGHKTYKRSMCFMLVKAIYDVTEHRLVDKVRIHYSVSQGYYCTIEGKVTLDREFLQRVTDRMNEMVAEDMPIRKRTVHTDEAIELFRKHGMYDKERLFATPCVQGQYLQYE